MIPKRAQVVVVGGGIVGTSIAFHLAEAGVDVCLLERGALGSGSTSRAAGGLRAQFSDELNILIGLRSLEAFARFDERPGADIELRQDGYLFLLERSDDLSMFEESLMLQNALGVPSRFVTLEEAARLSPFAGLEGVLAATYCGLDGTATPEAAVHGYANGARRHGARLITNCEVTGIEFGAGEIRAVGTERGWISTDTLVCAAGVWSPMLAEMVDLELPVEPLAREVAYTVPVALPDQLSFTVDFSSGLYFHREGPGLLFGMADPEQEPGFDAKAPEPGWLDKATDVAARRAPALLDIGVAGGWMGYYDMSPDCNALIGEFAEVSRFFYATGFSGHGFMQGPAVGEIVRDLILGRDPFVDVGALSAGRFKDALIRPEYHVI